MDLKETYMQSQPYRRFRHHALFRPAIICFVGVVTFFGLLKATLLDQDSSLSTHAQHIFKPSLPEVCQGASGIVSSEPNVTRPRTFQWRQTSRIVVLGDSISATMFDPQGEQPSADNPFGNPLYPTKRPNGPTWADYLTLAHNESQILTYNFAKGGATVDNAIQRSPWSSPSCSDQALQFLSIYGSRIASGEWEPETTLVIFRFGVNDCMNEYTFPDHILNVPKDIARYAQIAEIMYAAGLRNFLFFNIGPMAVNFERTGGDVAKVETLSSNVAKWNTALPTLTSNLTNRHADANAWTFNTHSFLLWLEENSTDMEATRQLRNTTGICPFYSAVVPGAPGETEYQLDFPGCTAPLEQYFWKDHFHPTPAVQNATAARIIQDCFENKGDPSFCT